VTRFDMFGALREWIDSGVTCICEVCEDTHIERGRLGKLVYGGAVPTAREVFLAVYVLIKKTDESDQDPLLRKLRAASEAHIPRPTREAVLAAFEQLCADVDRELESGDNTEPPQ
jgi:hypothetical protein